jgi:hypothetical protein
LIVDRDGGVEDNPHALTRSVSQFAKVGKRAREGAALYLPPSTRRRQ